MKLNEVAVHLDKDAVDIFKELLEEFGLTKKLKGASDYDVKMALHLYSGFLHGHMDRSEDGSKLRFFNTACNKVETSADEAFTELNELRKFDERDDDSPFTAQLSEVAIMLVQVKNKMDVIQSQLNTFTSVEGILEELERWHYKVEEQRNSGAELNEKIEYRDAILSAAWKKMFGVSL